MTTAEMKAKIAELLALSEQQTRELEQAKSKTVSANVLTTLAPPSYAFLPSLASPDPRKDILGATIGHRTDFIHQVLLAAHLKGELLTVGEIEKRATVVAQEHFTKLGVADVSTVQVKAANAHMGGSSQRHKGYFVNPARGLYGLSPLAIEIMGGVVGTADVSIPAPKKSKKQKV